VTLHWRIYNQGRPAGTSRRINQSIIWSRSPRSAFNNAVHRFDACLTTAAAQLEQAKLLNMAAILRRSRTDREAIHGIWVKRLKAPTTSAPRSEGVSQLEL